MKNKDGRILHIGNIANNAYQNAKILNEHGYENIVLSYDYYHVMGCPEWDDATIEGDIKNPNFPQWHRLNLNGFKRPDWFVAAPLSICIHYIDAYCKGNRLKACYYKRKEIRRREYIADAECNEKYVDRFREIKRVIKNVITRIRHVVSIIKRIGGKILRIGIYAVGSVLRKFKCNKLRNTLRLIYSKLSNLKSKRANRKKNENGIRERVEADFKELFPERECVFGDQLDGYIQVASIMKPILEHFDIVIGYATNPVFLYLAGRSDYIAYEHGTIRDIPYEDNDMGRLMLLAYAKAKAIYCTNIDCFESARYITKKTNTPIVCGLHGIDINALIKKIDDVKNTESSVGDFREFLFKPVFLCPARHSWDDKRKCYIKGEDKVLRAATRISEQGFDYVILMVEWGENTDDIKNMIQADINLKNRIKWIQPLSKKELYYLYSKVDAVLDQFILKAYGAISFEVLASGKPVLISAGADEELEKAFFGDKVLHYSCYDVDEIYDAMMEVINKTDKYRYYSQNGREWIKEHHSKECIYNALTKAMRA